MFIKKVCRSLAFAFRGIGYMIKNERNFKIHLFFAVLIIFIGLLIGFNRYEWMIVILLIAVVLSAEIFNSALERICDLMREKLKLKYEDTTVIRNLSAGAVIITALFSLLIGIILIAGKL